MTVTLPAPTLAGRTLADVLDRLGVPATRILVRPAIGTATEADVLDVAAREGRHCELVDGILVEKAMGFRESLLAAALVEVLGAFVRSHNLGLVSGPDGTLRLFPGLVRVPDVAFISWARVPGGRVPMEPIPGLVPDLVVEVLSESNTRAEMDRKRGEYFDAGVRLIWEIDAQARTATAYTEAKSGRALDGEQSLEGAGVLPGFALSLHTLFAELDRQAGPVANDPA